MMRYKSDIYGNNAFCLNLFKNIILAHRMLHAVAFKNMFNKIVFHGLLTTIIYGQNSLTVSLSIIQLFNYLTHHLMS
jgi:hypothetical protein